MPLQLAINIAQANAHSRASAALHLGSTVRTLFPVFSALIHSENAHFTLLYDLLACTYTYTLSMFFFILYMLYSEPALKVCYRETDNTMKKVHSLVKYSNSPLAIIID